MAEGCILSETEYKLVCQFSINGDIDDLKKLLEKASSDQRARITPSTLSPLSAHGTAPFVLAAQHGHVEVIQYLSKLLPDECFLNQCVTVFDIACQGDELHHVTALNAACITSNLPIVEMLLKKKASLGVPDCTGATPLNEAAYHGRGDVVELLCQHGADLHAANDYGWEPLHVAAYRNHKIVFNCLVQNGADSSRLSHEGFNVMHIAAARGHIGLIRIILKQNVNLYPLQSATLNQELIPSPLCLAAAYGYRSLVKLFCSLSDCTSLDVIDAYLLLGTSSLMKKDYQDTLACWQHAIKLREQSCLEFSSNSCTYLPGVSEVNNTRDLIGLCHPNNPSSVLNMWLQSLIVWKRCIGFKDITYWHMMINTSEELRSHSKFQELKVLLIEGTKLIHEFVIPQVAKGCILPQVFEVFYQTWIESALLCQFLNDSKVVQLENISKKIQLISSFSSYLPYLLGAITVTVSRSVTLMNLYGCKAKMPYLLIKSMFNLFLVWLTLSDTQHSGMTAEASSECHKYGVEFVSKFLVLVDGDSLIHFLFDCQFPRLELLLHSLLQWGGRRILNMYHQGSTCLHKACLSRCSLETIKMLLEYGAHFDVVDQQGRTFLDILSVTNQWSLEQTKSYFQEYFRSPTSLCCLSATAIIKAGLPYQHILYLPPSIKSLINLHDIGAIS